MIKYLIYFNIKETNLNKKFQFVRISSNLSFTYRRASRSQRGLKASAIGSEWKTESKGRFFSFQPTDRIEINRPYVEPVRASRECVTACAHDCRAPVIGGRGGGGGFYSLFSFGGRGIANNFPIGPAGGRKCIARCSSHAKCSISTTSIRSVIRPFIRMLTLRITPSARPCR